jgi:hypothetical protein
LVAKVKELEKENKELQSSIDDLNKGYEFIKNKNTVLKKQVSDLRCCGNCEFNHCGTSDKCYDLKKNKKCEYWKYWQSDSMTKEAKCKTEK